MEQKFNIGDKVQLKGGSPVMTVTNDKHGMDLKLGRVFNGEYTCSWFDKNDQPQIMSFPQDSKDKID